MKWLLFLFGFLLFAPVLGFCDDEGAPKFAVLSRTGFFVGTGGSVPTQATLTGGGEMVFFRDDYNHEISGSADIMVDRTVNNNTKILVPILANYRWYFGPKVGQGFFATAGLGVAVPFGYGHGAGSLAWQGGLGYFFSKNFGIDLRYIGRRSQTVLSPAGVPMSINNSFFGFTTVLNLF